MGRKENRKKEKKLEKVKDKDKKGKRGGMDLVGVVERGY